jgi:hypothetical protein
MGAVATWFGRSFPLRTALFAWTALTGALCALGGFAIASQPIGTPTSFGRLGASFVQWGFRASQGKLVPAVLISWLFWIVAGAAVILMTTWRGDRRQLLLALSWGVDALALLYVVGVILANRSPTGSTASSLVVLVAVLAGMIVSSLARWGMSSSPTAMRTALFIAGGPPLLIGGGYALFVLLMMTVGRNARWN